MYIYILFIHFLAKTIFKWGFLWIALNKKCAKTLLKRVSIDLNANMKCNFV